MKKETIGGKEIKMQAVIYSNGSQECERMASLIKFLGNDFHEYVLGVDFDDKAFELEFGSEATYPQVSIGYQNYVRTESNKPHGPYVADAYADVDGEEEEYGDRTDYR